MPDDAAELVGQRISVVLLTYNCAHRIAPIMQRLTSLHVPIIAVDNGSTDGTADVLAGFGDQVDVIRLPQNIGAAGRNVGAEYAHTPYLIFCDDDGWYEPQGLPLVCELFDRYPALALINAKILVRDEQRVDAISVEMADSPIPERHGLPGAVLMSFMAGAVAMRSVAYKEVGGYDARFFIGGEEETLSIKLAKAGWQMRYVPDFVMHHYPSLANAGRLRAFGMRNTLINAVLHRPWRSALRWIAFTLADTPKNLDFARGLLLTLRGLPWALRERRPMTYELDQDLLLLDARRFARRRPIWTRRGWQPGDRDTIVPTHQAATIAGESGG